jgi:hypothetical protein|tara:strand:- start:1077 stop:1550 length:474 start_codon:yes stop_codon:yes gene_type:complete
MLIQFQEYLTFENIYLYANFGILPFWLMLIIIPNSKVTQIFINSIILPLILSAAYVYVIYQTILLDEPILDIFKLYLSLDNLYTIFATESFLLVFWLHFLALNLFLGSWVAKDGMKYNISRGFLFIPLTLIYFTGPLGLVFYWLFRVFFAKRISLHD